ncbi:uncharacterized protein LOC110981103 isoform X2 [Acanthaster planci]|uniref:Uncharacterized protein LOC110981103 isoform X2 n=1 Tax=Acanthaster planci TaxID=133434 RepID=A0A8B7YRK0_ACAPL|nr:uncharacterized protein LOC110981103 isoform X2 [Acanthaster planci]
MPTQFIVVTVSAASRKKHQRDHVRPPQIVDDVTSARHLFALLENQRLLAENSLYFLQTLLYYIARPDLYQLVLEFRADRQHDYKGKGVDIKNQYQVNLDEDVKRLELANELLKFREDLKPRRRLNQVDVNEMRRKLNELSAKMKENIKIMQRPNAPQRICHDDDVYNGNIDSVNGHTARQDEDTKKDHKNASTEGNTHIKHILKLNSVKSDKRSNIIPKMGKSFRTELNTNQIKGPVIQKKHKSDMGEVRGKSRHESTISSTKESEDDNYYLYSDNEQENSNDNFGYETPCPPPRESALGINGIKGCDNISSNPIIKSSLVTAHKSSNLVQVASKIHTLRHQPKEQSNNSVGRVKRKKTKMKISRTGKSRLKIAQDEFETSNDKDDIKLPDIYDKYARQTAVHYDSSH